jgi:hypothetical protein
MPTMTFPNIEMPKIDLPEIDADRIANLARDAAYISVGFGVLAFQKTQVRRQELIKQLQGTKLPVDQVTKFIGTQVRNIDSRFDKIESVVDGVVDQVKDRLPAPADAIVGQVHGAAKAATKQVRDYAVKAV